MRTSNSGLYSKIGGLVLLSLLATQPEAHAATINNIYDFDPASHSKPPAGPLIADAAGNLYGVTIGGGTYDHGTVFRLSPPPAGDHVWQLTTLHSFNGEHTDGAWPTGTLAVDAAGNIYGTAKGPGDLLEHGLIFKLSPPQAGETVWTESVLHRFTSQEVYQTGGNIIVDKSGNLYGIGLQGALGYGFIFELSPPSTVHTDWHLKILHEFKGTDGGFPYYPYDPNAQYTTEPALMVDPAGVLYGTSVFGTAFELTPPVSGHTVWKEKVLSNFKSSKKWGPNGPLIADSTGALYGSLWNRSLGDTNYGQIFKLTPPTPGHTVWTKSTIFDFKPHDAASGLSPGGSLAFDSSGALYGETYYGGKKTGVVYKLSPPVTGTGLWSETVLSNLETAGDNVTASDGLVVDQNGNIFGAYTDRLTDRGSVFEITP